MKKSILLMVLIFAVQTMQAQQDAMFTQYINNMLVVNPAYAGSRDALTLSFLHRSQWVGIEGAPTTETFSIHGPLQRKYLGFGFTMVHDRIGPETKTGVYGDISGRVKVSRNAYLAAGLKFGLNFYRANLADLDLVHDDDFSFQDNPSSTLPNLGFGLYYYTPVFYAGVSIPKLIENDLYPGEDSYSGEIVEKRHYYFITGFLLNMSSTVKFKPSLLTRMLDGTPVSMDVTATFVFRDKLWVGPYYRYQESMGFLVNYNFTPQMRVGYSFDHTLSELQQFNTGTHEISLTYDFIYRDNKIKSPRYF